jgi:hypothetical protein
MSAPQTSPDGHWLDSVQSSWSLPEQGPAWQADVMLTPLSPPQQT